MPIKLINDLAIESVGASADTGGWEITAALINNQADADYGRRVDVHTHIEGGGIWETNKKLALGGSVIPKSIAFTRRQSNTSIIIGTSHIFLNNAGHQGIYFSNVSPSTNSHQIPGLNLGKMVEHLVEGHTNISIVPSGGWVDTSGIDTINSTSVEVYTVRQSNSIWSTIERIASNEFYVRYFTKRDKLIYEPHPQFKAVLPAPVFTITQDNIMETPEVVFREDLKTDQVQLYALTDTGTVLTAVYPALAGTELRRQKFTNLRCNSQARLNMLALRAYKFLNRSINVNISLAGAWGSYLELYDRVQAIYAGTARNGVTFNWVNKMFWINAISMSRVGNRGVVTQLELEEESV